METSLTPVQRAYRKFLSGRPPAPPKNTPLAAVNVVFEQRVRLAKILREFTGAEAAEITTAAIVIRIEGHSDPNAPADTIPVAVKAGEEGVAVSTLQQYPAFVVVGILFGIRLDGGVHPCSFPIERTELGMTTLRWALERQFSSAVRHGKN